MASPPFADDAVAWPPGGPQRHDIAEMVAHRAALVVGIVLLILLIWGATTGPGQAPLSPGAGTGDATGTSGQNDSPPRNVQPVGAPTGQSIR